MAALHNCRVGCNLHCKTRLHAPHSTSHLFTQHPQFWGLPFASCRDVLIVMCKAVGMLPLHSCIRLCITTQNDFIGILCPHCRTVLASTHCFQGLKLQYGHVPLYVRGDDANSKQFTTLHGVQRHMVDANKCKMVFDDNEEEYVEFYDWSKLEDELEGGSSLPLLANAQLCTVLMSLYICISICHALTA